MPYLLHRRQRKYTVCEGEPIPGLTAAGENIRWFSDAGLTDLVFSGNTFETGLTSPGVHTYYASQTISGCQSNARMSSLTIRPLPLIDLCADTLILRDQSVIFGPFPEIWSYLWNDNSMEFLHEFSGADLGLGTHTIRVTVTDTNSCINNYATTIRVEAGTGTGIAGDPDGFRIFPNPSSGMINLKYTLNGASGMMLRIFDQSGKEMMVRKFPDLPAGGLISLDLTGLSPGLYYVRIKSGNQIFTGKIILSRAGK